MIRGIHHIAIHTTDLDRLSAFYREAFGFELTEPELSWREDPNIDAAIGVPGSSARVVMLRAGNCHLELFEYYSPPGREGPPLRPNDRGYTHFCIDVTNIEREYERLAGLGMVFASPSPLSFGDIKAVYGKDPDGNVIEIQEVPVDHGFAFERLHVDGAQA